MEDIAQCYQILDLGYGASLEEVEKAYRELSKVWHPDRFLKESSSLQQKAREKQQEINRAYEQLLACPTANLPIRAPEEKPIPGQPLSTIKTADEAPIPQENAPSRIGSFFSDCVAPILRKAVQASDSASTSPSSYPRNLNQNKTSGQGRGQGQGKGRRQGQGQGRGRRNRDRE